MRTRSARNVSDAFAVNETKMGRVLGPELETSHLNDDIDEHPRLFTWK